MLPTWVAEVELAVADVVTVHAEALVGFALAGMVSDHVLFAALVHHVDFFADARALRGLVALGALVVVAVAPAIVLLAVLPLAPEVPALQTGLGTLVALAHEVAVGARAFVIAEIELAVSHVVAIHAEALVVRALAGLVLTTSVTTG